MQWSGRALTETRFEQPQVLESAGNRGSLRSNVKQKKSRIRFGRDLRTHAFYPGQGGAPVVGIGDSGDGLLDVPHYQRIGLEFESHPFLSCNPNNPIDVLVLPQSVPEGLPEEQGSLREKRLS
jgi:hypothetical protein